MSITRSKVSNALLESERREQWEEIKGFLVIVWEEGKLSSPLPKFKETVSMFLIGCNPGKKLKSRKEAHDVVDLSCDTWGRVFKLSVCTHG